MKHSVHLKILGSLALVVAAVLWVGPRVMAALNPPVPVHLTPLAPPFKNPIGIDFQDTSGNLIASINYPTGGSLGDGTFARIDPVSGTFSAFAPSVFGLFEEIKVAAVHLSSNLGGFVDGDVYAGNGVPGQIIKISANGLTVTNPWVTLPGETAHLRGSLFQDRYGAFGGDLIVVTGNEQEEADPAVNGVGKVWRVSSAGVPTLVRDFQKHLEGVTTIPNDPARYGPIAGRILVGDEDRFFVGGIQRSSANGDGAGCRVLAVAPDGTYITLTPAPTDLNGPIPNYHLPVALCPEDFDVITSGAPFFGVNYSDSRVLTAPASDFAAFCGDVLVSHEFPSGFANVSAPGVSGLNVLHWNPTTHEFDVTQLSTDLAITQWEHVTFAGGSDCATPRQPSLLLSKTPDGGTFTQGGQTTFTFFVTNNASGPTAGPAINVQLADNLPGNGGLVWVTATPTQGTCVSPIVGNQLHCSLGDIEPGGVVTVTVKSAASTPAAACQLQDNPLAFATADNSPGATDGGSLTCTPPPPPPPPLEGRMTGGGSVFTTDGVRVTHGFEIRCDASDDRQSLEINWPGVNDQNNFHLTDMTTATCSDDPNIEPPPPDAGFDTYTGEGIGTCNGQPATIKFVFTDAGEPGTVDTAVYHISGACTLDVSKTLLTKGNHQAHKK